MFTGISIQKAAEYLQHWLSLQIPVPFDKKRPFALSASRTGCVFSNIHLRPNSEEKPMKHFPKNSVKIFIRLLLSIVIPICSRAHASIDLPPTKPFSTSWNPFMSSIKIPMLCIPHETTASPRAATFRPRHFRAF